MTPEILELLAKGLITKEMAIQQAQKAMQAQAQKGHLAAHIQPGIHHPLPYISSLSKAKQSNPYFARGFHCGISYIDNGARFISRFIQTVNKTFIERNKTPCNIPLTGGENIRLRTNALMQGECISSNKTDNVYSPELPSEEMILLELVGEEEANHKKPYKKALLHEGKILILGDIILEEEKLVVECKTFQDVTIKALINKLINNNPVPTFHLTNQESINRIKNAIESGYKFAFYIDLTQSEPIDVNLLDKLKIEYFSDLKKKLGNDYPILLGENIDFVFKTTKNTIIQDRFFDSILFNPNVTTLIKLNNEIMDIAVTLRDKGIINHSQIPEFVTACRSFNQATFDKFRLAVQEAINKASSNLNEFQNFDLDFKLNKETVLEVDKSLKLSEYDEKSYTFNEADAKHTESKTKRSNIKSNAREELIQEQIKTKPNEQQKPLRDIKKKKAWEERQQFERIFEDKNLWKKFTDTSMEEFEKNNKNKK